MLQTSETSILLKECSHCQFVHLEHQRKGRFAVSDPSFNIIFLSKWLGHSSAEHTLCRPQSIICLRTTLIAVYLSNGKESCTL